MWVRDGADMNQYPFSITEETIIELLEVIDDADLYCPSEGLQKFIDKLRAIRDKAAEDRLREWGDLLGGSS